MPISCEELIGMSARISICDSTDLPPHIKSLSRCESNVYSCAQDTNSFVSVVRTAK